MTLSYADGELVNNRAKFFISFIQFGFNTDNLLLLYRKTEYKTQKIHIQQKKVYEEAVPKSEHIANYPNMVLQLS